MRNPLLALLVTALLLAAAAPAAADETAARRTPPRIVFGQNEPTEFRFREYRPLRRSGASTRQAYFGSGALYSETLAELQARMRTITARYRLEALPLTPAQEAAKAEMTPALIRALTLAKKAREAAAEE